MLQQHLNKSIKSAAAVGLGMAIMQTATAGYVTYSGLTIAKIRAVGDYQGTTFDNTLEVWPTTPLPPTVGSNCTSTFRFYIDAKNKHLVAAIYLALATHSKIDVTLDDALPIRDSACEASYVDVSGQ